MDFLAYPPDGSALKPLIFRDVYEIQREYTQLLFIRKADDKLIYMGSVPSAWAVAPFDIEREFEGLICEITEFQAMNFPNASPESCAAHLLREAQELRANPMDSEEQADVFLLLVGLSKLTDVNLFLAAKAKLEINKKRKWGQPDHQGVVEHVR